MKAKYNVGLNDVDKSKPFVEIENLERDINQLVYKVTRSDLINAGLTLIRNEKDILPIKKIKRKKFASIAFNTNDITEFQTKLSKYAEVDHFIFNEQRRDSLFDILKEYDLVFASVHNTSYYTPSNYKVKSDHLYQIAELSNETKVIFSVFANPYSLRKFEFIDSIDAVLIAYSDNVDTQNAAAQAVFGGLELSGKLPVGINSNYPVGTGIHL